MDADEGGVAAADPAEGDLDWLRSPCSTCPETPCCSALPVRRLSVETRSDLLFVRSLLVRRGVEVGLYDSGSWMLYFWGGCEHLDRRSGKCRVHGGNEQPLVCRRYSPHECWYRRVFLPGTGRTFLRLDLRRFDFVLSRVTFDEDGEIYGVPDWDTMVEGMASLPLVPVLPAASEHLTHPVRPAHPAHPTHPAQAAVGLRSGRPAESSSAGHAPSPTLLPASAAGPPTLSVRSGLDPCRVLWFPLRAPDTWADLDMLRFRLGFRGVELVLGEQAWGLLLHAECSGSGSPWCPRTGTPIAQPAGEAEGVPTCLYGCAAPARLLEEPPARFLRLDGRDFDRFLAAVYGSAEPGGYLPSLARVRRILARSVPAGDDRGGSPRPLSA
jgi:hypothetical protein